MLVIDRPIEYQIKTEILLITASPYPATHPAKEPDPVLNSIVRFSRTFHLSRFAQTDFGYPKAANRRPRKAGPLVCRSWRDDLKFLSPHIKIGTEIAFESN